jgi:hypothetical protein
MAIQTLYPAITPSLLLDFANVKALDPRVSFVRTTTATYYDGKTTAKAEENLLLYSQEFNNGYWVNNNSSVTANSIAAPDGTTTADTFTADGTNNGHWLSSAAAEATGAKTVSIFAKKGTNDFVQIAVGGTADPYANFDLNLGTTNAYGSGTTSSITETPTGSGWYRCVMTTTNSAAAGVRFAIVSSVTSARLESHVSSNTVYLWGAQSELRSAVTAYTPTTTEPITNYIPVLLTAAAGVARFDHNPTTGESLGLLVEEQRTNLLTYSSQFDDAAWTKALASITSNTIVAPDGTLTGDKVVEDTSNGTHSIAQFSPTSGVTYTYSIYAKAGERSRIGFSGGGFAGQGFAAIFNLANGTLSVNTGSKGSITSVGNGWYRCSVSFTTSNTFIFSWFLADNTNSGGYTGDGYSGIYIWGAQVEAGAFPTSYIPTVAASVTRNADAASMTGTNFSSWYRQDRGTVYAEANRVSDNAPTLIWSLDDGTSNNRQSFVFPSTTQLRYRSITNGTTDVSIDQTISSAPAYVKGAGAYKVNDFAFSTNGLTVGTDTVALVPIANSLNIGSQIATSSGFLNGTIKKLAFYPERISDAQLQALTTV